MIDQLRRALAKAEAKAEAKAAFQALVCAHFHAGDPATRLARHSNNAARETPAYADLSDVKGQQHAKRAMEVAAAGNHSLLTIGHIKPAKARVL